MARERYAGLSFEQVVQKYAPNVYRACYVRLQGTADVDDCVQNAFVMLYRKAPDFKDEDHLKAWLLRVAINECKKSVRDRGRFISLDHAEESSFPMSDHAHADDLRDASWALMRLTPKYREVLYLYYIERYKVDEIAAILGVKSGTVKSLLHRGRIKLREIYGGDMHE